VLRFSSNVGTVPGSEAVGRHVCPPLVVVHVQPAHVFHGEKQTTPLLQLTANGSPQTAPPSWQQASAGRVAVARIGNTTAIKIRLAVEDGLTIAQDLAMEARPAGESGQETQAQESRPGPSLRYDSANASLAALVPRSTASRIARGRRVAPLRASFAQLWSASRVSFPERGAVR
jgi:hypothetical protein